LEVASEFLEMAARLVHIKTVSLLPRHEEEAGDLKNALTEELMEYRLCRLAADELTRRAREHRVYVRGPMACEEDKTYTLTHSVRELYAAFGAAKVTAQRKAPPPAEAFSGIVKRKTVSVTSRIIFLLRSLYRSPRLAFRTVFTEQRERSEMVATFLALLELIRGGVCARQRGRQEFIFEKSKI
jgi:segregation and condensation protein A